MVGIKGVRLFAVVDRLTDRGFGLGVVRRARDRTRAIGFAGAFERQPARTDKIIDTMGAGDAFLCVASPFAAAGVPMKDLIRIGNAAGAIKVGIVGHRKSVDAETLRSVLNG